MAQGNRQTAGRPSAATASGEHEPIANEVPISRQSQIEAPVHASCRPLDPAIDLRVHAGRRGRIEQAVHYCSRRIRYREHSAIGFGFEFHAASLEPLHRITRLKNLKWAPQRRPTARIVFAQRPCIKARMRNVAAPAARDANLRQELRAPFEKRNARARPGLGAGNRGEKARRAAAHNRYVAFAHCQQLRQSTAQSRLRRRISGFAMRLDKVIAALSRITIPAQPCPLD